MHWLKTAFNVMLLCSICTLAWADRGHTHIGVAIGYPWAWPYPPGYYYAPYYRPSVIVQQAPPVYVEQAAAAGALPQEANYWYYCSAAQAYYPYVKDCPSGWQRVSPQPANP